MKRLLFLLPGLLLAGCDRKIPDTPETVMQDMAALLSRTADDLNKVTDAATAGAVRPKLQTAWQQWQDLTKRLDLAKRSPIGRNMATQNLRTSEIQIKVAKQLVISEWLRLSKARNAYGNPLVEEFKDWIAELTGQPVGGVSDENQIPAATVPY